MPSPLVGKTSGKREDEGALASGRVRPFQAGDGPALAALYRASVLGLGPRHYSPEQVQAWAGLCPAPAQFEAQAEDGRWRWLAVGPEDQPLAFADLEPDGHLAFLYCLPESAGQGLAVQLHDLIERQARQAGLERLFVEASEGARGFFLRQGYCVLHRRDIQVVDLWLHNYAMEKQLC
ncbi:GNAT family N-acetyltransferase [Fodinicurvata sediminis]|uniref:GNAT family N-acetyltransferase n=1 Tax=Fodinicurvata sediminis TaxID=1121832 RepID=UPI0003B2E3DB|nr:GNAT family N-acetyltransferase [Fodinicurvata sediminis]